MLFSRWIIVLLLVCATFAQRAESPFSSGIFEEEAVEKGPSKILAAGLSLLVPGAGELYLRDGKGATAFFCAEGAIWATFGGFTIYGNWRKQDYRNFAAINAGVRPEGKNDAFFEDVLNFYSRDEYNYWMHLIYRDQIPLYPETDEFFWEWQTVEDMEKYAEIRESSEKAYRNARTLIGVALINRVISVVHVLRSDPTSMSGENLSASSEFYPLVRLEPQSDGELGVGIYFTKSF